MHILEQEQLILRRQGRGTFVSERPVRRIPLLTSDFLGSMHRHAPELSRRVLACEWMTPPPLVAEALSLLPAERVLYAKRADVLEDQPVAWDEIYLTEATAGEVCEADLGTVDFLYRWQRRGRFELDYMQQVIEVTLADEKAAALLDIAVGSPLLTTIEVAVAATGQAAGYFVAFYPSQTYRLTATVKLAAAGAGRGAGD